MNELIRLAWYILFTYFALSTLHVLVLSIAGRFFSRKPEAVNGTDRLKFAILIPAYKEDAVILNSVQSYQRIDYPAELFSLFVIADSLLPATLDRLSKLPVNLLVADFDQSTVTKSIRLGADAIDPIEFPVTLICDADNILDPQFLNRINALFLAGHEAVQGCRYTKNLNTPMAFLDSLSEMINNHLYRKGTYALGLSSALIGSGMAFTTSLLQDCMLRNHSINGYDRELQLLLSERGITIAYLESAVCYDEKVSTRPAFENQRKRWLASQFTNLNEHFMDAIRRIGTPGGANYFQFAIIFNIFLTRLLNLGMLGLISLINMAGFILFGRSSFLQPVYWLILLGLYSLALALAIPGKFYNKTLLQAIIRLPEAFFRMALLVFKTGEARTRFMHTTHNINEVETSIHEIKNNG